MTDDTTRIKMRDWLNTKPHSLKDAEALILESVRNWAGIRKLDPIPGLDPGIAPWVELLRAHRIETYESCQGHEDGSDHAYAEPTIAFYGGPEAGFRAYSVAVTHALPTQCIRRVWTHTDHELTGPVWEIVFWRQASPEETDAMMHTLAFERGEA